MANIQIGGFRWIKSRFGVAGCAPVEERPVATANGTAIFKGDIVKLVSDGTVIAAAAGDTVSHVVVGVVRYKNSSGVITTGNFLPASTAFTGAPAVSNPQASVLSVIPLQGQILEADCDTAMASITAAQDLMSNNGDLVATAGNTTTGRSGFVMNTASGTGTGTATFRFLEVVLDPSNDVTAANWKVRVTLNEGNEPVPGSATGV